MCSYTISTSSCGGSTSAACNQNATTSNSLKPTVSYTLFLYREELRRRELRYMRLNKTKIYLTDELISKSVRNLKSCSTDDLRAISRELMFKKKLKKQVHRIRKLQKLGISNANPNGQTTEL